MIRRMTSDMLVCSSAARSSRSRLSMGLRRTDSTKEAADPIGGGPLQRNSNGDAGWPAPTGGRRPHLWPHPVVNRRWSTPLRAFVSRTVSWRAERVRLPSGNGWAGPIGRGNRSAGEIGERQEKVGGLGVPDVRVCSCGIPDAPSAVSPGGVDIHDALVELVVVVGGGRIA